MEKETSSRKRRESDSHRDRESVKEHHHHHHHHRSKHDEDRRRSDDLHRRRSDSRNEREGSRDRDTRRERERSHSVERKKRKDRGESEERDRDVRRERERSHSVERKRRKERSESEERSEKRPRVYDDNGRDRRRFEDVKAKEDDRDGEGLEFGRKSANEEAKHDPRNGVATGPTIAPSSTSPEIFEARIDSPATKVSSISKTNENKGVNSNRSHEVPGKSSTDGTASDASKSGGLSRDILAKAKIALQKQMEIVERMKKIPSLNRDVGSTGDGSSLVGDKGVTTTSSSGILPSPRFAPVSVPTEVMPSTPTPVIPLQAGVPHLTGLTAQNVESVKRAHELAAKMGFWQDPEFATAINAFPGQVLPDVSIQPKPSKAPVLRLDAKGREIDEEGKVVDIPKAKSLSTLKVNINKQKKDAFRILKPELDVDPETNPHFDPRVGINKNKLLRTKRPAIQFVEEGKWSKDAESIKLRSLFGEAKAKELKAKQAQLAKAKAEPDINPNLIEVGERVITKEKPKESIPDVEWWDVPFLRSGAYGDMTDGVNEEIKMDKITIYVEHPRPIEPPAEPAPPPPQPLKLTKQEQKKLRTQRRLAKEKDKQEMIRLGVVEPPPGKVKMSNIMKVLGSQATQDPTRLEMEIRSAAAEREQAHIDRNIARKLTPAERREKKERKLFDDPNTLDTSVAIYKINDLSHPQARFKVDVNAQQNRLSGCAIISEGLSVVVVEGVPKSVKRYGNVMLRRIDWTAAVEKEDAEEEDDDEEKPINKCVLVWKGSVAKPSFSRFIVQECRSESAARKFFSDHGVPHYWDLAVNFTTDDPL
ncbi:Pre-mRNA-splicing factor 3 [Perilla frutescens var. hirtella]|nr:Pre-mRNA-splicing factor 3 [Perilla frutescens var. hirtella]KAH6805710.1 Pre-mRNA-splicing factor 3 [Perilla frutescens var. frutescens]